MHLGLTDYKSYVGSNLGREWKRFKEEGERNGNQNDYFANPLGNQCVVVLNDGYHVFVNRSFQVAEGEGKLTCLGGHPEPSVVYPICINSRIYILKHMMTQKRFHPRIWLQNSLRA